MAYPVTGPHTIVKASGSYQEDTLVGWRQRRPYDLCLPLTHNRYFKDPLSTDPSFTLGDVKASFDTQGNQVSGEEHLEAYAKAYSRFVGDLGDSASLGVSLAQYNQAKGMIVNRANTLMGFAGALARRSPVGVARSLSISVQEAQRVFASNRYFGAKRQTKYAAARPLADLWLEFWFGWKPAVGDIYTACEVLSDPLPATRLKGTGKVVNEYTYGGDFPATVIVTRKYVTRAGLGADVSIVNPNLRLFQQMGLLNPFVVAFDVIPWSFVLGWFSNINSYLAAFTDLAGLDIQRAFITKKQECTVQSSWRPCEVPLCSESEQAVYRSWKGYGWGYEKSRQLVTPGQIPYPALVFGLKAIKPTRALTAISLLVQKLPR
jgi:hypothetical protein